MSPADPLTLALIPDFIHLTEPPQSSQGCLLLYEPALAYGGEKLYMNHLLQKLTLSHAEMVLKLSKTRVTLEMSQRKRWSAECGHDRGSFGVLF